MTTINASRQSGAINKAILFLILAAVAGGLYFAGSQKALSPAKLSGLGEKLTATFTSNSNHSGYGVQVMATPTLAEAKSAMNDFARDGYSAFVLASKNKSGILYKVRLGPYANKPEANAIHEKVRRRYPKNRNLKSSFVVYKPE